MTGEEGQRRVQDTGAIDVKSVRESLEHLLQGRKCIFHICTRNPTSKASYPRHLSCCIMMRNSEATGSDTVSYAFPELLVQQEKKLGMLWATELYFEARAWETCAQGARRAIQ
jgi:hypothetical protein